MESLAALDAPENQIAPVDPVSSDQEQQAGPPPDELVARLRRWIDSNNIALEDDFDTEKLGRIGQDVTRGFDIDDNSRSDWLEKNKKAMDLAMQIAEQKQYPWPKACLSLDTDILTDTGWKPIADVKIGERVLSRAADGSADYYPVAQTFRYQAQEVVRFDGKSIDLLATPNHRMLVEDRYTGESSFIDAGNFVTSSKRTPNKERLASKCIPLTSHVSGEMPESIYGIPAKAYVRFLGWYISEGWKSPQPGSFGIAQSRAANPQKCEILRRDIEACGFSYKEYPNVFIIHARSMPVLLKEELRGLGGAHDKHIPAHVLKLDGSLLRELLETLVLGDGHARRRAGRIGYETYHSVSRRLADQVQELCQKIGLRGTISTQEVKIGGVVNGRQIAGTTCHAVSINRKTSVQVLKLKRELIPYDGEVACVEVFPHHTIYVRRNGKAVWVGNSNVIYPLITTASIQFAARAYPAIIPGRNVVKGVVIGSDDGIPLMANGQPVIGPNGQPQWIVPPGAKRIRADKIAEHMSWQLLDEQEEWEPEVDTLLHVLPIVGCEFKKTFFDKQKDRNASLRVSAKNLVINYKAKSLDRAPRVTEIIEFYPLEIEEFVMSSTWRDIEYSTNPDADGDEDAPVEFLEQHCWIDLDDDGLREPYIVTVHKDSSQVVRIVARYDAEDIHWNATKGRLQKIDAVQYYTKYDFLPNPEGGIYGIGFGQLLRPLNESINTTLNMLLDAGHLANTQGGFIGKGLSLSAGSLRFQPGEYKQLNVPGAAIRDAIVQLQFPGPSPVLFQLLGMLVEAGKEIASVKDIMSGQQPQANVPATTVIALIEQGLQVFSAIYKRVYRSLKEEFDKLYRLNRLYLNQDAEYQVGDEWRTITQADYQAKSGVKPYSDPKMVSDMQRLGQAQFLLQFANDPMMDGVEIRHRVLDAASIENVDKLIKGPAPNPLLVAKAMELHTKQTETEALAGLRRAQSIAALAQSINYLAQADKAVGDQHIAWLDLQLQGMRAQFDAQQAQDQGGAPGLPPQPGQPGAPGGPAPGMPQSAPTPPPVAGVDANRNGAPYPAPQDRALPPQ